MKSKAVELFDRMFSEENAGTYLYPFWIWECNIGKIGSDGAQTILSELESIPRQARSNEVWETIEALVEYIKNGDNWIVNVLKENEFEIREVLVANHAQLMAESITIPMFAMA